jgi:hypothetical protein
MQECQLHGSAAKLSMYFKLYRFNVSRYELLGFQETVIIYSIISRTSVQTTIQLEEQVMGGQICKGSGVDVGDAEVDDLFPVQIALEIGLD